MTLSYSVSYAQRLRRVQLLSYEFGLSKSICTEVCKECDYDLKKAKRKLKKIKKEKEKNEI